MTLRRLAVLIFALPADSATWRSHAAAEQKALKPKLSRLRDRQAHYSKRTEEAT